MLSCLFGVKNRKIVSLNFTKLFCLFFSAFQRHKYLLKKVITIIGKWKQKKDMEKCFKQKMNIHIVFKIFSLSLFHERKSFILWWDSINVATFYNLDYNNWFLILFPMLTFLLAEQFKNRSTNFLLTFFYQHFM